MSRKVSILRWRKAGFIFCSRKNSLCELVGDPRPWDPSPAHRKDITRGSWSHHKKRIQRQTHSTANKRPKGPSLSKQKYPLPVGPGVEFLALSTVVNKAGGDISYLGVGISWKSEVSCLFCLFWSGIPHYGTNTHHQVFARITLLMLLSLLGAFLPRGFPCRIAVYSV